MYIYIYIYIYVYIYNYRTCKLPVSWVGLTMFTWHQQGMVF